MAGSNRSYFQFPICLMHYATDEAKRLDAILIYALVSYGEKHMEGMNDCEQKAEAATLPQDQRPTNLNYHTRFHRAYAIGMKHLNVNGGDMRHVSKVYFPALDHVREYKNRHGADAYARIRTDAYWECVKGRMKWRDFSTLAAVYSIIGRKPYPVRINRSAIRARQLGFKAQFIMTQEIEQRPDLKPLTENQVRYTLEQLECAGWFARVQASQRTVYFSHRLTRKQISDSLKKRAMAKGKVRRNRREDAALRSQLATMRAGL